MFCPSIYYVRIKCLHDETVKWCLLHLVTMIEKSRPAIVLDLGTVFRKVSETRVMYGLEYVAL